MVTPDAKVALVQNDDTNKVERLKLGDEIGGWEVQLIDSDNVVINKSNETKELALLRNKRKPTLKTTLRQELQQRRNGRQHRAENRLQPDSEQQQQGEETPESGEQNADEQNADEQNADQAATEENPDDSGSAAQQNRVQRVRRTAREVKTTEN
jgi:hypothetical protein